MDRDLVRWSLTGIAVAGAVAALLAAATIWLLLTDPVTVSTTVATGDVSSLMRATLLVLYDAVRGLVRYL
jgi:hypothetical protein